MPRCLFAMAIVLTLTSLLAGQDRVAHIFRDNMVLQRDMPVPIWGWAAPGTPVEVEFAGQKKQATANAQGYWKAVLDPMPADRNGQALAVRMGGTTRQLQNVCVGEVWVAAGQSNMVHAGPDDDTGVYPRMPSDAKGRPEIRVTVYGWGAELEPQADIDPAGQAEKAWSTMPENPPAATMGISNYFARVLRDELDVPVGIVRVAVPGTNQGAWMAKETLKAFPGQAGDFYAELLASHQGKLAKSEGPIKSWADMKQAEESWRKQPKGRAPSTDLSYANFPSVLYNTRIHPLAPLAFRGVIWHQGEAGPGGPYGERLAAMARQWRELFGHEFYFVWGTLSRSTTTPPPLAPMRSSFYRSSTNVGIRQALEAFRDDRRVALVELYDIGNHETHFLQKAEAGRRYALAALDAAYGKPRLYSGPRLVDAKVEPGRATLQFDLVGDGLRYEPSIDGISGFYLRGKSGSARWAQVKMLGKSTVELSHPDISDLETVAYGANPNPHEALFNSERLPASPFTLNPSDTRDQGGDELIAAAGDKGDWSNVIMQVAHVRREGYVFQLLPKAKADVPGSVSVSAYIPSEWDGFEVEVAGQTVNTTAQQAPRFISFQAPTDGSWIIVAQKGKASGLRKVNRY